MNFGCKGTKSIDGSTASGHELIRKLSTHGLLPAGDVGHVAVTELLLRCGADACLLDLSLVERREEAGEEEFETCKALVETSETVEAHDALQLEDESSPPTTEEGSREHDRHRIYRDKPCQHPREKIRYQVLDIADQSGAEEMMALHSSQVTHHGVPCDGPLCNRSATSILGTRYKCTICDNVDFARNALPASTIDTMPRTLWSSVCCQRTFE